MMMLDEERLRKLEKLKTAGIEPYPSHYKRSHLADEIHRKYAKLLADEKTQNEVRVAGRILAIRRLGKGTFIDLKDGSGTIQLHFREKDLGPKAYEIVHLLDIGDFLGAQGFILKSKLGTITVDVKVFQILCKSLRLLPKLFHGLKNVEARRRLRELDLLVNESTKKRFIRRSEIIASIRKSLNRRGYLEVESPMLSNAPCGAFSRPFTTRHAASGQALYLRISQEYIARYLVGGLEKIYELGRAFRNEGITHEHYPEFTLLEVYHAYADPEMLACLVQDLIVEACQRIRGSLQITFQGHEIDLTPPWHKVRFRDLLLQKTDFDINELGPGDLAKAREVAQSLGVVFQDRDDITHILDKIFAHYVQPHIIQPTIVSDHPYRRFLPSPLQERETSPPDTPTYHDEFFCVGLELACSGENIADPFFYQRRFEQELAQKEHGIEDAVFYDLGYVEAIEYGLPLASSMGLGIDRVAMLLMNTPAIKEVVLFPHLRPKGELP